MTAGPICDFGLREFLTMIHFTQPLRISIRLRIETTFANVFSVDVAVAARAECCEVVHIMNATVG